MTITKYKINRVLIIKTLIMTIFCTAGLYIYFVGSIAFSADTRSQISNSISQLQSEISVLEFSLIEESKNVNKAAMEELGLIQKIENEVLIVMRDSKTRLTFNE